MQPLVVVKLGLQPNEPVTVSCTAFAESAIVDSQNSYGFTKFTAIMKN